MKKGKLIVIDGIDGSGKTTQIDLIAKNLAKQGIAYEIISFPRYEDNIYGKLVERYLDSEFGSITEVNPYLIALAYAGDRVLAKGLINGWLKDGKIVLANRYVSASKAHLGANLFPEKREEFFLWLDELEYGVSGMPKEDQTMLLKIEPETGQQNVSEKHNPDLHEKNVRHLEEAQQIYLSLAKKENNWYVVDCMRDGVLRSPEDIHQEIMQKILPSKN